MTVIAINTPPSRTPKWSLTMDLRGVSLYDPTAPASLRDGVRFIRPHSRGRLGPRPRSARRRPAARRGRCAKAADGDPPPGVRVSGFLRAPLRRVTSEVSP